MLDQPESEVGKPGWKYPRTSFSRSLSGRPMFLLHLFLHSLPGDNECAAVAQGILVGYSSHMASCVLLYMPCRFERQGAILGKSHDFRMQRIY